MPVFFGAKWTWSVTACLGFRVTGNRTPEREKPAPRMTVALVMLTGAVPEEVKVTDFVDEEPIVTLPKLRLVAPVVNCGLVADIPMPLRLTAGVALADALLAIVSWPETAPVLAGLNCTVRVIAFLGLKVTGNFPPETLKPAPVIDAELIVTAAVPLEVRVMS